MATAANTTPLVAESVTARYSRFARESAGLANIAGGGFVLVSLGWIVPWGYISGPVPAVLRIALLCMPLAWIWLRTYLQRAYYQRAGRVEQRITSLQWCWTFLSISLLLAVSASILLGATKDGLILRLEGIGILGAGLCAAVLVLTPILFWKFLATASDFMVLLFLMLQSVSVLLGGPARDLSTLWLVALSGPASVCSILLIVRGIRDQFQFRRIEEDLLRLAKV